MTVWLTLLGFVLAAFNPVASAMTVETHGDTVFASGPIGDDLLKFEEAFSGKGIQTVVFVNSPGGDLWTGLRVGRLIADKGYKTVIAGRCVSACSIMFMGGKERRFSNAFRPKLTYIGIHGAHKTMTKQVDAALQPQIFAFFKHYTGERFNPVVINMALYDMEDAGSLLRIFDPVRSMQTAPYHCKSSQTPRNQCTTLSDVDAVSLGIITHAELVTLDLPTAFRSANKTFGQDMTDSITDMPSHLADMGFRACSTDACKSNLLKFADRPENRAMAIPLKGKGYGFSFNRDSPTQALAAAVYACNHVANQAVRLCEAEIINDFDVRSLHQEAEKLHKNAQASLTLPTEKFYANEEYGGSFTGAKNFRTEKFQDMTPPVLDGIETIGTQKLVAALVSTEPPVIVDVLGASETIPGSQLLLYGGSAQQDTNKDAEIEKRFDALLKLFVPNKSAPVIFYCRSRNSWFSVNAALRAQKLGYKQVSWYRGGLESWKAAALPTAPPIVRAAVN